MQPRKKGKLDFYVDFVLLLFGDCLCSFDVKICMTSYRLTKLSTIESSAMHLLRCEGSGIKIPQTYFELKYQLGAVLTNDFIACMHFVQYSMFWIMVQGIYLPTPVDFKTLPVDLRNFLALQQHHHLLLLLWEKNAARKFQGP